jgi:hypothetical protein
MKVKSISPEGHIDYDKVSETPVDPADFPFIFTTYKFDSPGLIAGRDPDANVQYQIVCRVIEEEVRKYMPNDKDGIRIAAGNVDSFSRMLCKIAHSYAIAELGFGSFLPKLTRFIRGKPLRHGWQWIGGDAEAPHATLHLHDIQWSTPTINGVVYVMVSLRLFSFMGSPRYHIIVGELTRPVDQLPFFQHPLYTIDVKTALPLGEMVPVGERFGGTGG